MRLFAFTDLLIVVTRPASYVTGPTMSSDVIESSSASISIAGGGVTSDAGAAQDVRLPPGHWFGWSTKIVITPGSRSHSCKL